MSRLFHLSLIDRYMLKRVCWPLAGAIVIGMAALLLERLIRLLDLFANRGGPLTLILKMLGNLVPHYLAIAIPAAFFVGILYATLRLSNDSELDVMRASGLSLRRLAAPMLLMAVVLTVASAVILGFLQPYTRYAYRALVYLVTETSWNSAIERGAFFSGFGGKTILIGDIADGGRTLKRIFIQETDDKGNNIALTAQTGELTNDPKTFSLTLILRDGVRVDSKPDGTGGRASTFTESKLPLEVVAPEPFREDRKESELSLWQLVLAYGEDGRGLGRDDVLAELNYRIVRILTVLFLPLLAIPMGLTSRRQPTSIRIVVGIAILIVYYQALNFGKDMAENGRASSFVALWVPFLLFAFGSLHLFYVANSRLSQDPFAVLFGSIDDGWRWLKRRWFGLFPPEAPGMMTFTRYALKTFLWNFSLLWISFTSLLQIVDLLNNSDEVLDRHPRDVGAVVEYAIWRLPELAVFLIPFSVLMAALLSLAKFERSNETLALKSAGAPYYQILLAFLPAVGIVAVLHFTLTDQIVPRAINHLMERDLYVDKKSKNDDEEDQRVWVQDGDIIVEVGQVEKQGTELFNMRLYERDDLGNITFQRFVRHATFDINTRKWTLEKIEDTKVIPDKPTEVSTLETEPWDTKLGPQEFSELIERPQAMTTQRLWSFATSEQIGVRPTYFYETWLQKRVALPVSSILMILLAAPVALSFGRRDKGVASGMAIGFGLGFLYFITEGLVQSLGESGAVPPFFAAWLPALLFASIGGLWLIRLEGF